MGARTGASNRGSLVCIVLGAGKWGEGGGEHGFGGG